MSELADQVRGGVDPLQSHAGHPLETRHARYAGRVVGMDAFGNAIVEAGSLGDVNCAMLWEPETRPMSGWAHAWPVVGGSPVRSSGRSSSAQDGAKFLAAFNDAMKGPPGKKAKNPADFIVIDPAKTFGFGSHVGGIGPATQDVIVLDPAKTFGVPFYYPAAKNVGTDPLTGKGAGSIGQNGGHVPISRFFDAAKGDLSRFRILAQGNGVGGPMGGAGQAGGVGGSYAALGRRVVTGDDAPTDYVIERPINDSSGAFDPNFAATSAILPPGCPSVVLGARGMMLSGTEETRQEPVYLHCDPRMVAVNEGPDYLAGSVVYDTTPEGAFDARRFARLQSAWRVVDHLYADKEAFADDGIGSTLAWQLCRGERDGVPGYGSIIDLSAPGAGPSAGPAITPSSPPANGSGPGWVTINGMRFLMLPNGAALTSWGPGYLGQYVSASQMATAIGASKAALASQRPDKDNAPALTVALSSSRVGGPLEVGHKAKDKHRLGASGDRSTNATHLATHSLFYGDSVKDGPLEFEAAPYTNPGEWTLTTKCHVRYDPLWGGAGTAMGHGWAKGPGFWRVETSTPVYLEPRVVPPVPPTTAPPPGIPPPSTPPPPPPTVAPPATTPGGGSVPVTPKRPDLPDPPTPGYPGHDPVTGLPIGLITGDGAGGRGQGAPMSAMYREFSVPRAPNLGGGDAEIGPPFAIPAQSQQRTLLAMRQRTERGMRPDGVNFFPMAVGSAVWLDRPIYLRPGEADWRSSPDISPSDLDRRLVDIPYTLRAEAWGAHNGSRWLTTSPRGGSRYVSGTMNGGRLYMPPELDMKDVEAGVSVGAYSTTYVATYLGAWFGAGTPVLSTGGLKTGARWGFDGTNFVMQGLSSASAAVTAFRVKTDGTAGIRTSSGPTILDVGSIADGETVKRSGSSLVGYTPTGLGPSVAAGGAGSLAVVAGSTTALASNDCVAVYLGVAIKANPTVDISVEVVTAYVGAGGTPYTKACIASGVFAPGNGATLTTRGSTDASAVYNTAATARVVTVTTSGVAAGDHLWMAFGTKTNTGAGGVVTQFRGTNADPAQSGVVQFKAAQDPAALSATLLNFGGTTFVPPFAVGFQY